MVKGLAILTVLLAVTQAPVPASGQATNQRAGKAKHPKYEASGSYNPSTARPPAVNQEIYSPALQGNTHQQEANNTEEPVRVVKLPSVSVVCSA
jgi:hypothetical protein